MRDSQRGRVYHAENILREIVDNSRDNPLYKIEGITLTIPPEGKFSTAEDVQRYVNRVTSMPSVLAIFGEAKIAVRSRKGQRIAHYEPINQTIAVPEHDSRWALREIVILHELAHHYSRSVPAHGPEFVDTMITLLSLVIGPEMGLLARILFADSGVTA